MKFQTISIVVISALLAIGLLSFVYALSNSCEVEGSGRRFDSTRIQLNAISEKLKMHCRDLSVLPNNEKGLKALVMNEENLEGWRGPYIDPKEILDPWGNPIEYRFENKRFQLRSNGPDEDSGTEDDIVYPNPPAFGSCI